MPYNKTPAAQLNREIAEALAGRASSEGTLYADLVAAGIPTDHHESDLYILDTPEARALLSKYGKQGSGFVSQVDRRRWLDVPFAYDPFWAKKCRAHSATAHARIIHQEPTGRPVFAAHERDHHITTSGRRDLKPGQFALPPGPEEKRRGIKGRLPIDTLARGRNALARAAQMKKSGHLSARQLMTVRRKVHAAWPSIESAPR